MGAGMRDVLILFYSRSGSVERLAKQIARGVEEAGAVARLRSVPSVAPVTQTAAPAEPPEGAPYVSKADLAECSALILGSPTRFGNMAAPVKYFLDTLGAEWASGTLAGKPAAVFTSTASMHGGQEATCLSMQIPLLHHGMLIVGIPFTETLLSTTKTGGTPYGASHVAGTKGGSELSDEEKTLARALGKRVAEIAKQLDS
jgi:NAD(P)H dehydrogenase (quinone)